jgi:hypothetical protein
MTDDPDRLRRHLRALAAVNHQLHAQLQQLTEIDDRDHADRLLDGLQRSREVDLELVRHKGGAVYLIEGTQRRSVRSPQIASALAEMVGPSRAVLEPELQSLDEGPPVELLVGPRTDPFVIVGGRRLPVRGVPVTTRISAADTVTWPEGPELVVGGHPAKKGGADEPDPDLPLPTFLIIGAQKSATRWLRSNLGKHPDIFTAQGELEFFHDEHRYEDLGPAGYRRMFKGWAGEPIVGEATPGYMMWRHQPEVVARRINEMLPDARLIAILRNPVDRAYSALLHHQEKGRIPADAELLDLVAAQPPDEDLTGLISGGWYAASLKPFVRYFGDQLLVLLHDDLADDTAGVFAKALAHVGAPPEIPPELERVIHSNQPTDDKPAKGPARPTDEERRVLYEYFRDDIVELEHMLGRTIPAWHLTHEDAAPPAVAPTPAPAAVD